MTGDLRLKTSKAQIKMFETIGVLIIFFFLLAIAANFYIQVQKSSFEKEMQKMALLSGSQIGERAFFMSELNCPLKPGMNCFDRIKLQKFAEMLRDSTVKQDYFASFGYSTIEITQIFPETEFKVTAYTNLPSFEVKTQPMARSPVLLYDPIEDTYAFGIIEVTTYA